MHIVIGNHDLSVNIKIEQNIEVIDGSKKRYRILSLLENIMDGSKMLIFCQTKRGADSLTNMLGNYGLSAISIHGDKTQSVTITIDPFFSTNFSKGITSCVSINLENATFLSLQT